MNCFFFFKQNALLNIRTKILTNNLYSFLFYIFIYTENYLQNAVFTKKKKKEILKYKNTTKSKILIFI